MQPDTQPALRRSDSGFKKFLSISFVIFLVAMAIFVYWRYFYTYSDGNRFGLLQKFSHRGNIFKTYEGELILSSIRGNANVPIASEKFYFSVNDKKVAQQLMDLQGRSITVHYKEKKNAAFCP